MKAPDQCERWKLRNAEEIIERLLAESSRIATRLLAYGNIDRTIHLPKHATRPKSDRYSRYWMLLRRRQLARMMGHE